MAMNKRANHDSGILRPLCSLYEKNRTILLPCLLVNLFKHRHISSVDIYKYLSKFISIKTVVLTF